MIDIFIFLEREKQIKVYENLFFDTIYSNASVSSSQLKLNTKDSAKKAAEKEDKSKMESSIPTMSQVSTFYFN